MNIFPTIVTTSPRWKEKIKEADEIGLTEVAVFPTMLDKEQRKELYSLLSRSKIKSIPFVHLRSDMDVGEMEYFIKKYNTQVFNVHSSKEYPINKEWLKYASAIGIENIHDCYLDEDEIKKFGGICLDFTHLENDRMTDLNKFYKDSDLINKIPIKCNHLSAIKKVFKVEEDDKKLRYDSHYFEDLSEFNYLKKYSLNLFSDFCALEVENTLKDQLKAKEYVSKLITGRDAYIKKYFNNGY
jgi:hypothetical protein